MHVRNTVMQMVQGVRVHALVVPLQPPRRVNGFVVHHPILATLITVMQHLTLIRHTPFCLVMPHACRTQDGQLTAYNM